MSTRVQQKAKSRIIQTRLLGYLEKNGEAPSAELAKEIGRSTAVVYNHMLMLCAEGKAHSTESVDATRGKMLTWHLGIGDAADTPDLGDTPVCTKVNAWPPHHVRDPLVAFLFGAVNQVEARA